MCRAELDTNERSVYYSGVAAIRTRGKGAETRQTILNHALSLATRIGMEGLTIGRLAEDLGMSKSGLIAHFQTKESLQVQVLETGAHRFVEDVLRPALKAPRGEPRLRALFHGFLAWESSPELPGGCPLIAASTELDDRPGPARDYLVRTRRDLFDLLAGTVRSAIEEGQFRADVDAEQFVYEFWGVMLGHHHASRLMRDPRAAERAARAFETLVAAARADARPVPSRRAASRRSRAHRRPGR
jgi:AcrR family transcriptional regulator